MDVENYRLVRTKVRLHRAELYSISCVRHRVENPNTHVKLHLEREIEEISPRSMLLFLTVTLSFEENAPFDMTVKYLGHCVCEDEEYPEEDFKAFAFDQVVPLLLPYARECVSSTLGRMQLPVFTIPTMDILESIAQNSVQSGSELHEEQSRID